MTEQEQIDAFIRTGRVKRVAPSVRTMRERDMHHAVRGESYEQTQINRRRVVVSASGRQYVTNGLGERIA